MNDISTLTKLTTAAVEVVARATVPTRHGLLDFHVFRDKVPPNNGLAADHVAVVLGDVDEAEDVLVRVHSECLTSEVFSSLKCDCAEQLECALGIIAQEQRGVVLYLRQEGRGIGLANKIRAYALQAAGADTLDANRMLDLPDDERDYLGAAAMLGALGVRSVALITNNPGKIRGLERQGVMVSRRIPSFVAASPLADEYLSTKIRRMGHLARHSREPVK
jgi:GTP cyclohydrolase II